MVPTLKIFENRDNENCVYMYSAYYMNTTAEINVSHSVPYVSNYVQNTSGCNLRENLKNPMVTQYTSTLDY